MWESTPPGGRSSPQKKLIFPQLFSQLLFEAGFKGPLTLCLASLGPSVNIRVPVQAITCFLTCYGLFNRFAVILHVAVGNSSQKFCSDTDLVPNIALASVER